MGLFIKINNRNNFLLKEVQQIHPATRRYSGYWRKHKKRIIEGFWAPDNKDIDYDVESGDLTVTDKNKGSWRYMPSNLYFYVNFGTILHRPEGSPKTAPKKPIRPHLRDFDWEFFYNWAEARGFSGFENDDEYTCLREVEKYEEGKYELHNLEETAFNKDGNAKKYIPAKDYLRQLHNEPLGLALFDNEAKNMFLLGARGGGKSMSTAVGIILHEIITDGAKEYNQQNIEHPYLVELFVGAAMSSKSSDLLSKVKLAMEYIPGAWKPGKEDYIPAPLYKHMSGSLQPNNMKKPWAHRYEKKIGGEWKWFGSGSNIKHGIFSSENPEAAAGGRYTVIVIEEVGLLGPVLTVHGGNEAAQMTDGTVKFGSAMYLGCVCAGTKVWSNDGKLLNIEDLKQDDGIVGYHSKGALSQKIEKFTKPQEKPCYKIEFEGGGFLECSDDHPIFMSKMKAQKQINWEKYKTCTFREAKNIKVGDQVGLLETIPIFGNKHQIHARMLGLLIGDGYMWDTPELSVDNDGILNYIKERYSYRIKRQFMTKKGSTYRALHIHKMASVLKDEELLYKTKDKKTLPKYIDEYDKESLAEFIGGYFDADGTVKYMNNGNVAVALTSNLYHLIEGVKYRLSKFGITSSIIKEKRDSGYEGGQPFKYVLYISRYNDVVKFAKNIKFTSDYKQKRLEEILTQSVKKKSQTSNRLLYVSGDEGNFFEDSTIVEDILFRRVKNVEYIGDKLVYNLTAGGTHSYLANNVITHNTGGNIEKIVESEIIFRDPESFEMLAFDDVWEEGSKIGWFVPATHMDGNFKDENGNTIEDKAIKNYEDRRVLKRKAKSSSALDLEMMNYPLVPSEMFLSKGSNRFPIADLKARLAELLSTNRKLDSSWKGWLNLTEDGKVEWSNDKNAKPIIEYPLPKKSNNIEGCIEIFEMPVKNVEEIVDSGIYIASLDPVDDDDNSDNELSLQSVFIMNNLTGRIVAEYTGRTKLAKDFYEQTRRLLLFYNAQINYENNKKGFYGHMYNKNCLYLLAETPEILKDKDMQKSTGIGNKSLGTNANSAVNEWGLELTEAYLDNQAYSKEDGVTNVQTIRSIGLLYELIKYNGKLNADRVSSIGLLLIMRENTIKRIIDNKKAVKTITEDKFWNRIIK